MSDGIPYADIVILALVAGFIVLRLRSVLGSKPDEDEVDFLNKSRLSAARIQAADPIVQLDSKNTKPKTREEHDPFLATVEDAEKLRVLESVKAIDPQFNATDFVDGARMAFEMVFDAFNKGDKPTLKMLLSDEIYQTFCREIDARHAGDHNVENTLVSVKAKELTHVALEKNIARIGVAFTSEQVSVERNANGDITGGDASLITHVDDSWLFERDLTSKSPNWKIIET